MSKSPDQDQDNGPLLCSAVYARGRLRRLALEGVGGTVVLYLGLQGLENQLAAQMGHPLNLWQSLLVMSPLLAFYVIYIQFQVREMRLYANRIYLSGLWGWRCLEPQDIDSITRKGDFVTMRLVDQSIQQLLLWPKARKAFLEWTGTAVANRWEDLLAEGGEVIWFGQRDDLDSSYGVINRRQLVLHHQGQRYGLVPNEKLHVVLGPNGCRITSDDHTDLDIWLDGKHENLYAGFFLLERMRKRKQGYISPKQIAV